MCPHTVTDVSSDLTCKRLIALMSCSSPPACRSSARHPHHHERPGRRSRYADDSWIGAVEGLLPDRDAFVVEKLKKAGAVILAKATLGELGGGDTHGSLFGSTKNPYDLERTADGSSGGSGASVSANFCTVAVGQEDSLPFAAHLRGIRWLACAAPKVWSAAQASTRAGPSVNGSLGPMARDCDRPCKAFGRRAQSRGSSGSYPVITREPSNTSRPWSRTASTRRSWTRRARRISYVPGLRAVDRRFRRLYARPSPGRRHFPRPALR
jgi:hypothetical protein